MAGCLVACLLVLMPAQARDLVYPGQRQDDKRNKYPLVLLERALAQTAKPYRLIAGPSGMVGKRSLHNLALGRTVDVVWSMTTQERERALRPIRIPIHKGLIGWRLPLIHRNYREQFNQLYTVEELRQLRLGQVHDWPDTNILKHNGFRVQPVQSYRGVFRMLVSGRLDYFPRSIVEIWDEAATYADSGIEVDEHLLIYYPAAFYFFVNHKDTELAEDIERGLNEMLASGEFDELFNQYNAPLLQRAQLHKRTVIRLENPLLPEATPLARADLWYSLEDGFKTAASSPSDHKK